MTPSELYLERHARAISALRAATEEQHGRLHEHPLFEELLARPSRECYRAVLEVFLRFHWPAELSLVESSRRLGVPEQYPERARTRWLLADLGSLGCEPARIRALTEGRSFLRPASPGELVGCLYVIKGSALGGRTILRQLRRGLRVDGCCRFLTGEGARTVETWSAFQRFCERVCASDQSRREAIEAARRTFEAFADCLGVHEAETRGPRITDNPGSARTDARRTVRRARTPFQRRSTGE